MSTVIGCGTHLGKQQTNFVHLRCCGIKKACARIQNKWNQKMWDDFENTLSKHGIPIPSSKQRKKQSSNETEENDVSIDDLYLIAQEIIKIETPLKPKYFSMNSKIYNAYLTKKSDDEPDVLAWGSIKQQKSSKNKKKRNKEGSSSEKTPESVPEPDTNMEINVNHSPLRTLSPPTASVPETTAGLFMIDGFFLRCSDSSNPSYPRPVIHFLEDILPEEVDYWECSEEDLRRAEIYISAMELDDVEFKKGKFIVKDMSVIENLPQEDSANANSLFGLPIEILTPSGGISSSKATSKVRESAEQIHSSPKNSTSKLTPRTTRSKSMQLKEEEATPTQTKRPKTDK